MGEDKQVSICLFIEFTSLLEKPWHAHLTKRKIVAKLLSGRLKCC